MNKENEKLDKEDSVEDAEKTKRKYDAYNDAETMLKPLIPKLAEYFVKHRKTVDNTFTFIKHFRTEEDGTTTAHYSLSMNLVDFNHGFSVLGNADEALFD